MSTAASSAEAEPPPDPALEIAWEGPTASSLGVGGALRVVIRIAAILVGTAGVASAIAVAWIPTVPFGQAGSRGRARIRRPLFRLWGKGMMWTLGVRVSTEGKPPPRGSMIVSNHLSYLDIATLASVLPTIFVSKAEVERWPFWGTIARIGGTIFIDRRKKRDTVRVLSEIDRAFSRGDSVIVFPEATSTDGCTILPFKSSLLASAAMEGNPVEWLTVSYRTPDTGSSARNQVCWWGDAPFLPHFLGLCAVKRIDAQVTFGETPARSGDRKALAQRLHSSMLNHFTPVI